MSTDLAIWIGLFLSFLAVFVLSMFHITLDSFSKIQVSRFLEDREKADRHRILKDFDDTRTATAYLRVVVLVAFLTYLFIAFPRLRFWPLWLFLIAIGIHTLFFEALPRLINFRGKNAILKAFLPAAGLFRALGSPILLLTRNLGEREEREEKDGEHEATDEEIETFLDEAREEGIIEKGEDELLRSVVEFGDTIVREIMTPRVTMVCIRKDSTIDNLKDLIIREKYSRIPVYKDRIDNIDGVVMAKDIIEYADEKHKGQPIEALIRPVIFVPESMEVADLLKEFQKAKQKMAVVVDEHGGVSGLVTMEDVVEEIVGEIQDEYDTEEAQIVENAPGDFTVSGRVEVEEMEELLDLELAEDDFITVGGLVTHNLGRLPAKGEMLDIKGLSFEILDVEQKRVKKIRIKRKSQDGNKE
ncbi:HlyC/CorC family transporter [bacterium]|nr:MAG: HlyC/CorC family transporter [bacterium]